ncbi:KAT8 regulatory NSL complex subunit 3 [Cinnamomum micranthum f. kanehirae]|uniref:KAT8 regulatory NSL complex subunit 3 n=1 Tax=Cinnamomum micranthum f. kanehirae TaxID=337451 RepID=A0A443Q0C9_9MAGN|nr:KAT8 regulatory NSL complex subunit 3 [Cinnamomum micranthum f. kanehirae]
MASSSSSSPPPPSKRPRRSGSDSSPDVLRPLVVFAHGAGSPSTSDWMIRMAPENRRNISGGKQKAPPKAEKLVEFHSDIVRKAVAEYPGHPLILVGKSMGSRVSCIVAGEEDIHASAIVCLGYPLKGINGAVRDDILLQLSVPIMFVQGSKDGLCPLDRLSTVQKKMNCVNELHVIDGGDHSFKIGKKFLQSNGSSQAEAEEQALRAIAEFIFKSIQRELIERMSQQVQSLQSSAAGNGIFTQVMGEDRDGQVRTSGLEATTSDISAVEAWRMLEAERAKRIESEQSVVALEERMDRIETQIGQLMTLMQRFAESRGRRSNASEPVFCPTPKDAQCDD